MYADTSIYASRVEPMEAVVRVHRALADPTRLRILHLLLAYEELCVCDFEALLGLTQSRASRHLKTLREARLVADRRDGTWAFYRTSDEALPMLTPLVERLRNDPTARDDLRRARGYRRQESCAAPTRPTRRRKRRP